MVGARGDCDCPIHLGIRDGDGRPSRLRQDGGRRCVPAHLLDQEHDASYGGLVAGVVGVGGALDRHAARSAWLHRLHAESQHGGDDRRSVCAAAMLWAILYT